MKKHSRKSSITIILLGLTWPILAQQVDTIPDTDQNQEIIEDFLQNTESEGDFDFNTIFEEIEAYRQNPLNINEVSESELRELRLLSDVQVNQLLNYRQQRGPFIAMYELQAVPGFDLETIRRVIPYLSLNSSVDDYQLPILQMIREGKNEFFLRWSRILEEQKGYTPLEEGQTASRYEGDPNKLYFRYKHSYSNKLSYGVTAEKDRGESFFSGSNEQGFDFYSAHFYLRDYNNLIRAVAIGDFSISMGQGLILFNGFSQGKSSSPMLIKRSGRVVRPYTSVNEADFMRGGATTLRFGQFETTLFGSVKNVDGNLISPTDTLPEEDIFISEFTSLRTDGLHRTASEIEDEGKIQQQTAGGVLKYKTQNFHIAFNALYNKFNRSLQSTERPYNQFYFRGDALLNASLDYSFLWQNFNFFGETAWGDNGQMATINGLLIGLDRRIDFSILHRYFPKDYQALTPDPFAETSGARNENGIYLGLEIRPARQWVLSGYFDAWKHPWIRFSVDAPYSGYDYRARLTHFKKRTYRIYLEVREEHKFTNAPDNETKLNYLTPTQQFQTRLHIAYNVSKSLELRNRIDYGFFDNQVEGRQKGFVILQDILYRPIGFPLSFTTRFALFDTPGYDVRFYHYENNLLYTFSIPPYYNRGTRFYINLRYKGIRNMTIECRYAQTHWRNLNTFGSGLEEIDGPGRTEVAAQIKYQF